MDAVDGQHALPTTASISCRRIAVRRRGRRIDAISCSIFDILAEDERGWRSGRFRHFSR